MNSCHAQPTSSAPRWRENLAGKGTDLQQPPEGQYGVGVGDRRPLLGLGVVRDDLISARKVPLVGVVDWGERGGGIDSQHLLALMKATRGREFLHEEVMGKGP